MSRYDTDLQDAFGHRHRSTRQVRHEAKTTLHRAVGDSDALEDADLTCPTGSHDLGRYASPAPHHDAKPGRRGGFKVWKTPFWKRRTTMRASRNDAARRLA